MVVDPFEERVRRLPDRACELPLASEPRERAPMAAADPDRR
jgi:hypothetical protein